MEELLGHIVMSSLNVSEVASVLLDSQMSLPECEEIIFPLISHLIPFDASQALMAASLEKQITHKGLSLGDRACMALGIKMKLPVYTADQVWADLGLTDIEINLIR
nr:type II toxin-antitoxin system VapC family toxin [Candidatus Odyssella thessalonicensis]